jgi:hypothetical protein
MADLVGSGHKSAKLDPRPEEYERVSKIFQLMGGSWERVFKGSVDDVCLLKKTIKVAVKQGVFTKAAKWG